VTSPRGPILPPPESVTPAERETLLGQRGLTLWLTGLSGSGKSTLARALERALTDQGRACFVLDGDVLRGGLNADLGFSPADREENVRRVTEVARLLTEAGLIAIASCISPYAKARARARERIGAARFLLVHAAASVDACRARDPKGLYARADRGELLEFTGVSAPYEIPTDADLVLDTAAHPVDECLSRLLVALAPWLQAERCEGSS
jgi:adenylyl-sulfate kinase